MRRENSVNGIVNLFESISKNEAEFQSLCVAHDVKTLHAFGSVLNNSFDEQRSDIDLLVELDTQDPIERGQKLMNLWEQFEGFFQRKVDLLTNSSIRNPVLKKSIDASKILIYDRKEQEVSFWHIDGHRTSIGDHWRSAESFPEVGAAPRKRQANC